MRTLLAALLAVSAAQARPAKKISRDPRTVGLGSSCKEKKDCKHRLQKCIKENDANGKPTQVGFCVLPCTSFEAGVSKVVPGETVNPVLTKKEIKKKPPPRCPKSYECRSAGAGVPLDMCVKQ